MSLDFSGLSGLRQAETKAAWAPLTRAMLGQGWVLAFDQSLGATGWVEVRRTQRCVEVLGAGTFGGGHTELARGVEQDLRRGVDIYTAARQQIRRRRFSAARACRFAHESPPHGGNVKGGGDSSLLAAMAVRAAAKAENVEIEMLGAQPAKRLVCGNANADKKTAHVGLKSCFGWIEGTDQITNESHRDALCLALLWLSRRPL